MDLDDFRSVLESASVDVWMLMDAAITVASLDYGNELKNRRDGIVERLYAATSAPAQCRNCQVNDNMRPNGHEINAKSTRGPSPSTPQSLGKQEEHEGEEEGEEEVEEEDNQLDPYGGLFDDEQKKILEIKEQLEDPQQSEESVVELLQNLADMDITFQALKETDIGRHVNRLRKHPSNDVRRLVKLLVRKWKDIVDEWVKLNQPGEHTSLMADGDSPQQKNSQNGHHQIPEFAYSPNPHNGSSGSERNNSEAEPKPKAMSRKEAPRKPAPSPSVPVPSSAPPPQNRQREQRDSSFDAERLASARRRLQENYKEAENAKKQRTIQVMDIHDLPKPKNKNVFFGKNKGGGGSQGRHW
ncbi:hypothetical protein L6164_025049 [Bauhinia variegata]|uniref:Uncharacterized protein n=1 Tax=Bauhinia variegata TaxID=167791 RepID=A0ACB9LZP1_BAUVA|nr:hypothetical protein L6164_025049 [Bauhinia variegata]